MEGITTTKNKELLIFSNPMYDYQISFNLNTGDFCKIQSNKKSKKLETLYLVKNFFAHYKYEYIIKEQEFPIYYKIIKNAGTFLQSNITNMGTVLSVLREHLVWEQYFALGIDVSPLWKKPISYFPKDIIKILRRISCVTSEILERQNHNWRIL